MLKVKVGDRVRFVGEGLGICQDTVRGKFMHVALLEPYAQNRRHHALVLTKHSWCLQSAVIEVVGHDQKVAKAEAEAARIVKRHNAQGGPALLRKLFPL